MLALPLLRHGDLLTPRLFAHKDSRLDLVAGIAEYLEALLAVLLSWSHCLELANLHASF